MNPSFFYLKKQKPQLPFIITMKTTTASGSITMPIQGTTNNYKVDWGDGVITSGHTATANHVYAVAGSYDVKISGKYDYISFNGSATEASKAINIKQWGTTKWTNFTSSFWNCNFTTLSATDKPDLSNCNSLLRMFRICPTFNTDISSWDTSKIVTIKEMFRLSSAMSYGFAGWDVTSLTDGSGFLDLVTLPTASYDATLIAWSTQSVKSGVTISFGNSRYSSAAASARALLISKGWTITDGGMV